MWTINIKKNKDKKTNLANRGRVAKNRNIHHHYLVNEGMEAKTHNMGHNQVREVKHIVDKLSGFFLTASSDKIADYSLSDIPLLINSCVCFYTPPVVH